MHVKKLVLCAAVSAAFVSAAPHAGAAGTGSLPLAATVGTFTPTLAADSVSAASGAGATIGLQVDSHAGFAGTVMVTLAPGAPAGVTMAPVAVAVGLRQSVQATLTVNVAPGTPAGEYPVSVRYDSGTLHKNWPLLVKVSAALPVPHTLRYGYTPTGSQIISGGRSTTWNVPNTEIHQTSWAQSPGAAPNIQANYAFPDDVWQPLQWRWADTMRSNAVTRAASPGAPSYPSYRFEIKPSDHASPGTAGDHPRAELFSVDGYEAARGKAAPRQNVIRQGDEYWATWSMYLASDFPTNHQWSTLFQRKFDNVEGRIASRVWFEIAANGDHLSYCLPMSYSINNCAYDRYLMSVTAARGKWIKLTIHEKASTGADGLFELYMNGRLVESRFGPTIEHASADYNFHYGYYRSNDRRNSASQPPGTGVVYMSPLMIARVTPIGVPGIPVGKPSFIPGTP